MMSLEIYRLFVGDTGMENWKVLGVRYWDRVEASSIQK